MKQRAQGVHGGIVSALFHDGTGFLPALGCTIHVMNSTPASDAPEKSETSGEAAGPSTYDEESLQVIEALEDVLAELAEHHELIPLWEFYEGALTALVCTRREIPEEEWIPALLGLDPQELDAATGFASEGQRTRFIMNWMARQAQIHAALDAQVESLEDPGALDPAVLDLRALAAAGLLEPGSEPEGAEPNDEALPAFGRLWAEGFMAVVNTWEEDWAPPRDKAIASDMADMLECVEALCEDDTATPDVNIHDEQGPASVSQERLEKFGEALWAVYDLYAVAKALGPRVDPVRNELKIGRNDPCVCGSGKKYKKCCGA